MMVAHGVLYWWQRRDASQRFLWHVANLLTCCEMSGSCKNSPLEFPQLPLCAYFPSGNDLDSAERQNIFRNVASWEFKIQVDFNSCYNLY